MNFLKNQPHKGFTLIETLFAILIFSAALISLMTIAGRGISATSSAREQISAHYLAQEGLEIVRNIRDTNFVNGASWDTGFTACVAPATCRVTYGAGVVTPTLDPCTGSTCAVWQSNGDYVDAGFPGAAASPYSRTVTVTPVINSSQASTTEEYLVTSTVGWTSRTISRSVTLKTLLKKWQGQ